MFIDNFKNYKELIKHCRKVIPSLNANEGVLFSYPDGLLKSSKVVAKIDVAFPVFHGTYGEDGSFQGVFEIMNIPYVGSNVSSSAVCMNKSLTKEICKAIHIPIIEYYRLDADSWFKDKETHLGTLAKNVQLSFNSKSQMIWGQVSALAKPLTKMILKMLLI